MDVGLRRDLAAKYVSASQRARVLTEDWAERELYCPACTGPRLERHKAGAPVSDFFCSRCEQEFQLKGKSGPFGSTVTNSAFQKKIDAIRANRAPNYVFVHYDVQSLRIASGFFLPGHFLTESVVAARRPLTQTAQRHGWVGSTILLSRIPLDGRIPFVEDFEAKLPADVRASWDRFRFLTRTPAARRGWIEDVLRVIRELGKQTFHLNELYAHEAAFARLHPANRNIRPKIRQQVELLRDRRFLKPLGAGRYVIVPGPSPGPDAPRGAGSSK